MADIIERDAINFARVFPKKVVSLKVAKEELLKTLGNFSLDKHKLAFLTILRREVHGKSSEHNLNCTQPGCNMHKHYDTAVFSIDQELESLSQSYIPEVEKADAFTIDERVEVYSKLNEVLEKLEELGLKQQIVFEEVDSLKEHFNLGKKSWLQLLKGKIFDLGTEKMLEATILKMIYDTITKSLNAGFFVLPDK